MRDSLVSLISTRKKIIKNPTNHGIRLIYTIFTNKFYFFSYKGSTQIEIPFKTRKGFLNELGIASQSTHKFGRGHGERYITNKQEVKYFLIYRAIPGKTQWTKSVASTGEEDLLLYIHKHLRRVVAHSGNLANYKSVRLATEDYQSLPRKTREAEMGIMERNQNNSN